MLHVAQISFFLDPLGREPERLLEEWPSLVDVAEAVSMAGVRVSVIQACVRTARITRNDVEYHFLAPGDAPTLGSSRAFGELIGGLGAHVFHVHGLGFAADVVSLAALAPRIPIIVQDHANQPPRIWRRRAWRRGLSVVSGAAFCSVEQALPFVRAGVLAPGVVIHEVPESTSRFSPGDRAQARAKTGLQGDPCILWVGHLNENKDPLTVLRGVREAARELPGLQLWCCFGEAPMLSDVRGFIDTDDVLRTQVHLVGRVPHDKVETLMRGADLFVSGSHREGSGYSLIEALACGLTPVVTDIPSFRSLTADGAIGRLWPCGEAHMLRDALLSIGPPNPEARRTVRAHFDAELSFAAVGRKLCLAYQQSLGRAPRVASGSA